MAWAAAGDRRGAGRDRRAPVPSAIWSRGAGLVLARATPCWATCWPVGSPRHAAGRPPLLVAWLLRVGIGSLLISVAYLSAASCGWPGLGRPAFLGGRRSRHRGDDAAAAVAHQPARPSKRLQRTVLNRESIGYLLLAWATLWLAFGVGGHSGFKALLPALPAHRLGGRASGHGRRHRVRGAAADRGDRGHASAGYSAVSVAELQILAMAMAVVGFFVGARWSMNSAAPAPGPAPQPASGGGRRDGRRPHHELHQPLTALTAYAGACEQLIEAGRDRRAAAFGRCVACCPIGKAGDVVRRLQDFFRTGDPSRKWWVLVALVEAAIAPLSAPRRTGWHAPAMAPMPDACRWSIACKWRWCCAACSPTPSIRWPTARASRGGSGIAAWKDGSEQICLRVEDSARPHRRAGRPVRSRWTASGGRGPRGWPSTAPSSPPTAAACGAGKSRHLQDRLPVLPGDPRRPPLSRSSTNRILGPAGLPR